eukprot:scaffold2357_cov399-Prasinococcus_capsulatus_cf.AAC.12
MRTAGYERLVRCLPFPEDREDTGLTLELLKRRLGMDHSQFAQLVCFSAEQELEQCGWKAANKAQMALKCRRAGIPTGEHDEREMKLGCSTFGLLKSYQVLSRLCMEGTFVPACKDFYGNEDGECSEDDVNWMPHEATPLLLRLEEALEALGVRLEAEDSDEYERTFKGDK